MDSIKFLKNYEKIRVVGKGTFGIASLYRKKITKELVVLKEINIGGLPLKECHMVLNEVEVLSALQHPNIIRYYGSFLLKNVVMIEMEFADGGTLNEMLSKQKSYLAERTVLKYLQQISSAIEYIHEKNILHRDLKTANVFIKGDENLKIGDFGISKFMSNDKQSQTVLGTPNYMSPEMCEGKEYNEKSDMWSMGCILYEICSLRKAFEAMSLSELVNKIVLGKFKSAPIGYSNKLKELINEILDVNPEKRPAAKVVCNTKIPEIKFSLGENGYDYPFDSNTINKYTERSILYELTHCEEDITIKTSFSLPKLKITNMCLGRSHFIAVTEEGSVYTWGDGKKGQLGIGIIKNYIIQPRIIESLAEEYIVASCAGNDFSILLSKNGKVFSFGDGTEGALGHGDWNNCCNPKAIESLATEKVRAISCSLNHVGALTQHGKIFTWGCGLQGQIGHDSSQSSCVPVLIETAYKYEIISLHMGFDATMAITSNGSLLACGYNNENRLSISRKTFIKKNKNEPVIFKTFKKVHNIPPKVINCSIGVTHCAIVVKRFYGSLAIYTTGCLNAENSKISYRYPTRITQFDNVIVKMIACGPSYIVIGTDDNAIKFWGIRYKIKENKEHQDNLNVNKYNLNSSFSTGFLNTLVEYYTSEQISNPLTLVALYASQQMRNIVHLYLSEIFPMKYKIMFLVKSNTPLQKVSLTSENSKSQISSDDNSKQNINHFKIPKWIEKEMSISNYM